MCKVIRAAFVCLLVGLIQLATAFRSHSVVPRFLPHQPFPSHLVGYDYFKKGPEKKEIGRLWKNILFPGIFVEYADTKEVKKTVKVETKTAPIKSRYDISEIQNQPLSGTYNVVDAKSVPKVGDTSVLLSQKAQKAIAKPKGFVAPTPKRAMVTKPGSGLSVLPNIQTYTRPKRALVLYEYEGSAECKKVREACTILDIPVEVRPCPGGRYGFSDLMTTLTSGRRDIPFLVDSNPSMYKPQLFGAKDIVEYLFDTYGPGKASLPKSLQNLKNVNGASTSGKGSKLRANARSDITRLKPIVLYGWEGVDYVRVVRETLTELGVPHVYIPCAPGSSNRSLVEKKTGTFQVPYIQDPNTGVDMFESKEIVAYLEQVYTF
eukprot:gene37158-45100_t